MEDTDLSYNVFQNISCDDPKIEIKNEPFEFEVRKDNSSILKQDYSSPSAEMERQKMMLVKLYLESEEECLERGQKEPMSYNPKEANLKAEKLSTANLSPNTQPSNSEVVHPVRNDGLPIKETLKSQENLPDHSEALASSLQELKSSLENISVDDLNSDNCKGSVIGQISEKLDHNLEESTNNKASGESREVLDKEKNKKKSHLPPLISKSKNEEAHCDKHKVVSTLVEKNKKISNLPSSSRAAQKLTPDYWLETSGNRENQARKIQMPHDRNIILGSNISVNRNTNRKSRYPSKKDYCRAYPSDQSKSDKKNYYRIKTLNPSYNEESRKYKQFIPQSNKIENKGDMRESFSYNNENCSKKPRFFNVKKLTQKPNVGCKDNKVKDSSCTDNEPKRSCDIYKANSKNDCGDRKEVNTSGKENEGEKSRTPSPLTDNTVTNDCGKMGDVQHDMNHQQVLFIPLNNSKQEEIEEATRVEKGRPEEVPSLPDTQRKNINENPREVSETLNTKETQKSNEDESDDSSEPGYNPASERDKSIEVIDLEEDHLKEQFSCPQCSFATTNKMILNIHLNTHSNVNSFRNPHDDMRRIFRNAFRNPRKLRNQKKRSSKLKCSFCDYNCKRKNKFEKHLYENHLSKKIYKCNSCSYECSDVSFLKRHAEKHFGKKTVSANSCHKFPSDSLLQPREMGSQKRTFPDGDERHNRNKRRKVDSFQATKLENIMIGLDKLMNNMKDNVAVLTKTIITQANEVSAVTSCLKRNINAAIDTSGSKDSSFLQPSTSKQQQISNPRYNSVCVNCQAQASTSGAHEQEPFYNLNVDQIETLFGN